MGTVGFANDLLLMEKMLPVCEDYAKELNLDFHTDPDTRKSKSLVIFITGSRMRNVDKPKHPSLQQEPHIFI